MAKRITDEQIIQINEVYLECGVKSKTAQIVGVSASTVTKYLIPNYKSQKKIEKVVFDKPVNGVHDFINAIISTIDAQNCTTAAAFCKNCVLTKEELEEMKKIQKGVML